MPNSPKGTAAAVIIFLRRSPQMSNKELASILRVGLRRIQQIRQEFESMVQQ